jgi:hypothetical protein
MARSAHLGGLLALAGVFGLVAAALVGSAAEPPAGTLPVFVLVSLSLVVGLSTAASP